MKKITSRKKKFLEESLKLIHEKGFKATSMRDIAEHMNFEVANIYNYIDSKQALLETFLFDISDQFHNGIKVIIDSDQSPEEKITAFIQLQIQLTSTRPYEVALLVNEWRNLKEPKLSAFIKERHLYESYVSKILKEGMDSGAFRKMDLDVAVHLVLSSVRWLYSWYTSHAKAVNPKELENQIATFLWNGLQPEDKHG